MEINGETLTMARGCGCPTAPAKMAVAIILVALTFPLGVEDCWFRVGSMA